MFIFSVIFYFPIFITREIAQKTTIVGNKTEITYAFGYNSFGLTDIGKSLIIAVSIIRGFAFWEFYF